MRPLSVRSLLRLSFSFALSLGALAGLLALLGQPPAAAAPLGVPHAYPGAPPCNTTLQACINGSSNGDRINIAAGKYVTSVTLNKAVSLVGANASTTILSALPSQRVLTVTGSTITNSTVISGLTIENGDALFDLGGGIALINSAQPLLENLVITNNHAGGGGGIGADTGSQLTLVNVDFISNTANVRGGGAAAATGMSVTVVGGQFLLNHSEFDGGGGLSVQGGLTMLTGTQFLSNTATCSSAACAHGGGLCLCFSSGSAVLNGVLFQGNRTDGTGGGLFWPGPITLADAQFIGNRATSGGGLFALDATVLGGTFEQNVVSTTVGLGGGLLVSNSLSLHGTLLQANSAYLGGGAYVSGTVDARSNTQFIANTAAVDGGGLWANDNALLSDARFSRNRASSGGSGGGAIVVGNLRVTNSDFSGNSAGTGGGLDVGGAVASSRNTFQGNSATQFGGGMIVGISLNDNSSTFEANHAGINGGGLYGAVAFFSIPGATLRLDRSTFISNTADNFGGGVFAGGPITATGVLFRGNDAAQIGAALNADDRIDLEANQFIDNQAGASAAVWHNRKDARIVNSLFARNTIPLGSSGETDIALNESFGGTPVPGSVVLLHDTFADPGFNPQPAIEIVSGTLGITDTIVVSHSEAIKTRGGSSVYVDYSLFFGNNFNGVFTDGGHNLEANPLFADPGADDYHLTLASPAIDAGIDAGVASDFDGDARPIGAGFDIGFDEFPAFVRHIFLPLIVK